MKLSLFLAAMLVASAAVAVPARADVVQVTITGRIETNEIAFPPLDSGNPGDPVEISFLVHSDDFVDKTVFPTRLYVIDESSFRLDWGGAIVGLEQPHPGTPHFALNDEAGPGTDGFALRTNAIFSGVTLDATGPVPNETNHWGAFYPGGTLDSLDILDAVGAYDLDGLEFSLWFLREPGSSNDVATVEYESLTIESVAECYLVVGGGPGDASFNPGHHVFDTQVDGVQASYPVLLDDIPDFVIPTPTRGPLATQGAGTATAGPQDPKVAGVMQGVYTVQVLMWNPGAFPQLPEQSTHGLMVSVDNAGHVTTRPYGDGTGMEVWAETDVNEQGQHVVRFPFSIPGLDP